MSATLTVFKGVFPRFLAVLAACSALLLATLFSPVASAVPAGAVGAAVPAVSFQTDPVGPETAPESLAAASEAALARKPAPSAANSGATKPSAANSSSATLAPADSPIETGPALRLPDAPEGYQRLKHGWLEVDVPPSLAHWGNALVKEGEAFRTEVNARLGFTGLDRVVVRVAEDAKHMLRLAPPGAPYPEYADGVAYSRLGLILLTVEPEHAAEDYDLLTTFRHELAHVALYDATQHHDIPLWFNEGLAIHLSRENAFARSKALWSATISGNLLPLKQIDRRFPKDIVGVPLAYAESADVVRYLLRTQDQERFRLLIKRIARGQAFEAALSDSYGMDLYNLESLWQQDVRSRNTIWPVLLSGTVLWGFGLVLIVLAWRRKRAHKHAVMQRWEREEAIEAERARAVLLARAELVSLQVPSDAPANTVAGVLWSDPPPPLPGAPPTPGNGGSRAPRDSQVPRVEHDGNWHTLH
jgi:Peptidase MA superfamily